MLQLKICFVLLLLSCGVTPDGSSQVSPKHPINPDTIRYLKNRSEALLNEKKYEETYRIFNFIADYYSSIGKPAMFWDYNNKASNCYSKYSDPKISLDSAFQLFRKYDRNPITDTILTDAIIQNFITNHDDINVFKRKMEYLDFIKDSAISNVTLSTKIRLGKHRLKIASELDLIDEQLNSYYYLLNLKLPLKDEVQIEIALGGLYQDLKEYQLSNITLNNTLLKNDLTNFEISKVYNLLGGNYLKIEKYSLSQYYLSKSLEIEKTGNNNNENLIVMYNNLANYYNHIGNLDSSRTLYNRALDLSIQKYGINSQKTAFYFNNIGNQYRQLAKYDSALIFYDKAVKIQQASPENTNSDIVYNLSNMGQIKKLLGDTMSAVSFWKESIRKNYEIAKYKSLKNGLVLPDTYIFTCSKLGEYYLEKYYKSLNNTYLDSAKDFFRKAIYTNDSTISTTPIESKKIKLNLSNKEILENYLKCFLIEDANGQILIEDTLRVISLFDKCHNYILLSKLIDKDIYEMNSINSKISYHNQSIDEAHNQLEIIENDRTSNLIELYELSNLIFKEIRNSAIKQNKYIGRSNTQHSYAIDPISLKNINQSIDLNTVLLEYTVTNGFLYCISLTKKSIQISKIGNIEVLKNVITNCNRKLNQFSLDFNQLYELSKILLSPLINTPESITKIIVIKDEDLLTIPFDILLLAKPESTYQNNSYLIKKYDISYSYSINHFLKRKPTSQKLNNFDFIGFSPITLTNSNANNFQELEGANKELANITSLFSTKNQKVLSLYGSDANIENFYKLSSKANILHLATHSDITGKSKQKGFILNSSSNDFTYDVVTYYDVLNLTTSPNLVVLASCSSNSGKLLEGEGIQNIGRAFSIKGASYVISSLYRLDDEFSHLFMTSFYNHLLISKEIKNSLCKTKRAFIASERYSYPTYWSNFNIIGE